MKEAAMPIVCTGLRDDAQITAETAVFGRNHTLDDLNFSDCFSAHDVDLGKAAVAAQHDRTPITVGIGTVGRSRHAGPAEAVQAKPDSTASGRYRVSFAQAGA